MAEMESQQPSAELIAGVVMAPDGTRVLSPLVDVDALALLGCAAEDPADWNDLALVWPRYRFDPENTEFADGLPINETDKDAAISILAGAEAWIALDLIHKRVHTGGGFPPVQLRGTPADDQDQSAQPAVLPPWWELQQHVQPAEVGGPRATPIDIPHPRRDVLWGAAMTRFFAEAMMAAIREGQQWIDQDWEGKPCGEHGLSVQIHRDWLMTPRPDLGGSIPRDCLHGGQDWIDDVTNGQSFRVQRDEEPIPIPMELSTYENAPMGSHEIIVYFDACRETIAEGWSWLINDKSRIDGPQAAANLGHAMDAWLALWLQRPFEDGQSPAEIIRCNRVRIPLVDRPGDHVIDCDCPICDMMAAGLFGPAFVHFDGHQLELDGEFAFSMCATRQQWEEQQHEWEEINACIEADMKHDEAAQQSHDDELESVWKNTWQTDDELPGDTRGHLGIAFLVADMVNSLKLSTASQEDADELNVAFRNYRCAAAPGESHTAARAFKRTLEILARKHEYLVSRSADLQSRIDEFTRRFALDGLDTDLPC